MTQGTIPIEEFERYRALIKQRETYKEDLERRFPLNFAMGPALAAAIGSYIHWSASIIVGVGTGYYIIKDGLKTRKELKKVNSEISELELSAKISGLEQKVEE